MQEVCFILKIYFCIQKFAYQFSFLLSLQNVFFIFEEISYYTFIGRINNKVFFYSEFFINSFFLYKVSILISGNQHFYNKVRNTENTFLMNHMSIFIADIKNIRLNSVFIPKKYIYRSEKYFS